MGKFFDALEKAKRESHHIKKGLREPVPIPENKMDEDSGLDTTGKKQSKELKRKPKESLSTKNGKKIFRDIDSLITEQFLTLKTRIFYTKNGSPPRTLLVTSAIPNEGKSMVAANLAVSLAQGVAEHALLIDCDFRRPNLHEFFGLVPEKGLTDYLNGRADLNDIFLKTDTPKLSLLPCGEKTLNPVNLLASEKMKDLFRELKSRYNDRFIIIDSPPIQFASETRLLASRIDGVVLVIRAGKTNRKTVLKVIKDIGREKILGIVLNGLEKSLSNRYYCDYKKYK